MRRAGFFLSIVLLVRLCFVPTVGAQSGWSYEGYLQFIGQLQGQAEAAQTQSAAGCAETLERIAIALESITQVRMPDGSTMPVRHAGGVDVLRQSPCNPDWAIRYLSGICPRHTCPAAAASPSDLLSGMPDFFMPDAGTGTADMEMGPTSPEQVPDTAVTLPTEESDPPTTDPTPATDDVDPQATADPAGEQPADGSEDVSEATDDAADAGETETGSETDPAAETTANGAVNDNGSAIDEAEETAVSPATTEPPSTADSPAAPVTDSAETSPPPPTTEPDTFSTWLLWLGLSGLLFVLGALTWLLWEDNKSANKPPPPKKKPDAPDPAAVLQEGQQSLQQGDARRAVRQLFLATLLLLEERGELPSDRALTNYELLRAVKERPSLATALAPVVDTFERVWYGFESLAAPEYEQLVAHVAQIKGGQAQ
jgi:hypothetical protein